MALLPYMLGDWPLLPVNRPSSLLDQDFGITPNDMLSPFKQLAKAAHDLGSSIKSDKDNFQVNIDVQHFAPEEISVKTADGYIIVEGKHEERRDQHGYVSRQFSRRYALPEGCQEENIQSRLSSDGVLTITAPKQPLAVKGQRAVPIQQTGPVRKEINALK